MWKHCKEDIRSTTFGLPALIYQTVNYPCNEQVCNKSITYIIEYSMVEEGPLFSHRTAHLWYKSKNQGMCKMGAFLNSVLVVVEGTQPLASCFLPLPLPPSPHWEKLQFCRAWVPVASLYDDYKEKILVLPTTNLSTKATVRNMNWFTKDGNSWNKWSIAWVNLNVLKHLLFVTTFDGLYSEVTGFKLSSIYHQGHKLQNNTEGYQGVCICLYLQCICILFTLWKPRPPLVLNGEWGFLILIECEMDTKMYNISLSLVVHRKAHNIIQALLSSFSF